MKRALVDLSSVIWTHMLAGKDNEHGKKVMTDAGKEVLVNSAIYGYELSVKHLVDAIESLHIQPRNMIFVMEGMNSKADRQAIHAPYKAGRDKIAEQYEQFNICKQMVLDAFLSVGAQMCWQDGGVEADDVIGYLAKNLQGERYIISGDKDLAQLVGIEGVHHYRQGQLDKNPFGPFAHQFIPVAIALWGDASDKIPGARGFGEKAFEQLLVAFGDDGLELMEGLIKDRKLDRLEEDVEALPVLRKIMDDADNVYTSYELGRLRTERVNTVHRPLQWRAGMVKPRTQCEDERLRKYAGMVKLVSAENYDEAMKWAKPHIERSPDVALDIETSTPPESDDWLEQLGKSEDKTPVDVFGSELTGLSLTFGQNGQYTLYLAVDHKETPDCHNITKAQAKAFIQMIPRSKIIWVHNFSFEGPVLYNSLGDFREAA